MFGPTCPGFQTWWGTSTCPAMRRSSRTWMPKSQGPRLFPKLWRVRGKHRQFPQHMRPTAMTRAQEVKTARWLPQIWWWCDPRHWEASELGNQDPGWIQCFQDATWLILHDSAKHAINYEQYKKIYGFTTGQKVNLQEIIKTFPMFFDDRLRLVCKANMQHLDVHGL